MKSNSKKQITMHDIFGNPRYSGKHVILAEGKVYAVNTGKETTKILEKLRKENPDIVPEIAYIMPRGQTLIV